MAGLPGFMGPIAPGVHHAIETVTKHKKLPAKAGVTHVHHRKVSKGAKPQARPQAPQKQKVHHQEQMLNHGTHKP